jgi:hypothetical protein
VILKKLKVALGGDATKKERLIRRYVRELEKGDLRLQEQELTRQILSRCCSMFHEAEQGKSTELIKDEIDHKLCKRYYIRKHLLGSS